MNINMCYKHLLFKNAGSGCTYFLTRVRSRDLNCNKILDVEGQKLH